MQVIGYSPRLCPFDGNRSVRGITMGDPAASVGIVQSLMLPPVWSECLSPSSSRQIAKKVRERGHLTQGHCFTLLFLLCVAIQEFPSRVTAR